MATGAGRPPGPVGSIEPTDTAQAAASDEDKAAAAEAQSAADAESAKGPFVVYTGPQAAVAAFQENERRREKGLPPLPSRPGEGTYAEITVKQWEQVGIKSERSHVWKLQNNYRIAASQFSAEQIDYLLNNSKRFQLVDGEGNPVKR